MSATLKKTFSAVDFFKKLLTNCFSHSKIEHVSDRQIQNNLCMREWLSWWSTTLPRSGPRVRVPSRALCKIQYNFIYARVAQLVEHDLAKVGAAGSSPVSRFFYFMGSLDLQGFPFFFSYHFSFIKPSSVLQDVPAPVGL